MTDLLPPWPLFAAFLAASVLLAITPGPAVAYIVTRSLTQGREAGLVSVGAVAVGNLGNALATSVGLAALFAASAMAFTVVKYAGAAYLVYLGVQMFRGNADEEMPATPGNILRSRVFRDGLLVALFNPKTTMFYAAFLPQFLGGNVSPLVQSITLSFLFVMIAAITDGAYALAAGAIAPCLRRTGVPRAGRYLGGGMYVTLGILAAGFARRQA